MKNHTVVSLHTLASLVPVVLGLAWILEPLSQVTTAEWGVVVASCTPQAVLITGGLGSPVICACASKSEDSEREAQQSRGHLPK